MLDARPRQFNESIPSIERWTDAFLIYLALLVAKKLNLSPSLVRYMTIIREAAQVRGGFSWRNYDTQFRLRQAVNPRPWCEINADLWMRCMTVVEPVVSVCSRPLIPESQPAAGKCYNFNNGFCSWPNCSYLLCGDKHPRVSCTQSSDTYC